MGILPDSNKGGGANCVLNSGPGGAEMCAQMNAGALISTYGPQGSAREAPDPTYSFEAALCKPRTPWAWCWGAPCYKTPGTPTGITCECPYITKESEVAQPLSLAGKGECAAHPPLYNPCEHIHNAQLPFADVQSEYCFIEAGVTPPCVETCSPADGPPGPGPPPPSPSKSKSSKGRSRKDRSSAGGKCPDLLTYCLGQPKCETTEDCPPPPPIIGAQSYTCKEGSCYEGAFPLCIKGGDIYKIECN